MAKTFSTLIQETIQKLSQVTGTGVQLYAEDRIAALLQEKFNFVFSELWWPAYMDYFTRSLDGTSGIVTATLSDIKRYEDIRYVWRDGYARPLPGVPPHMNPLILTGTTPKFVSRKRGDNERWLQFWPKTATGTVYITARVKPDEFTINDEMEMDSDLLVNGAAWDYATSDGTNPADIAKFQTMFETRLAQLKRENSKAIVMDERIGEYPLEWTETL